MLLWLTSGYCQWIYGPYPCKRKKGSHDGETTRVQYHFEIIFIDIAIIVNTQWSQLLPS